MRRSSRLGVTLLLAVAALAVVLVARHDPAPAPDDRPTHLVDLPVGTIERIEVRDPATGRTARALRSPDGLVPAEAGVVAPDRLRQLEADLAPLLAVRLLDRRRPDYGLDPPALDVTITAPGRTIHLLVGSANFDGTAVYVGIGRRTALVLPDVGTTLGALVGQAEP